jgi:hypothetical protein
VRHLFWILLVACSVSCSRTAPGIESGGSGAIEGEVRRGPMMPVERDGVDNTAPLSDAKIKVTNDDGRYLQTITSGPTGTFQVRLPAGAYVLEPLPFSSTFPTPPQGQSVVVIAGATQSVRFDYDTGIR